MHYINTEGWVIQSPSADFSDYLHPSDAGHVKIMNRLAPILQPYLSAATPVNDTQFSFDSTANWPSGTQTGAYQGDNHWSNVTGAFYQVPFSGTQVKLYGGLAPAHGIAAVSIDGGAETNVDTYAATRADGVLLWTSPVLANGTHTLKVRVTGTKNASATNTYITADRADIVGGGPNLLTNPGFENGLSGWGVWPAGPSYTETWGANAGTSHLTHWGANPYYVTTYQGLTGLSNGLYTLKARVKGWGGQRQMYVKNFGAAQMTADLPGSNDYTEVVISNINVTNGTAEIGFFSNDPSGNTALLYVDDVTFYKQ